MTFDKPPLKLLIFASIVSISAIFLLTFFLIEFHPSNRSVTRTFCIEEIAQSKRKIYLTLNREAEDFFSTNASFPFPSSVLKYKKKEIYHFDIREKVVAVEEEFSNFNVKDSICLTVYPKSQNNLFKILVSKY